MADCVALRQSSGYNDASFDIKRFNANLPSLYPDNLQQYNNAKTAIRNAKTRLQILKTNLEATIRTLEAGGCSAKSVGANFIFGLLEENEVFLRNSEQTLDTAWQSTQEKEANAASTKTNNQGTGKPGTAGTGPDATPAAKPSPTTIPTASDPAYKEAPRGADDFGDVAPGLEATKPKIVAEEPNLVGAGTVNVTEPTLNFSEETGADTNTGLQEATDDAQAQATVQDAQNWALQGDWRVRLALAPQSPSILYRADEPGVLAPLKDTDGVIFPYTPNINVTYSANYEPLTLTHTNYKTFQYQSSSIDQIVISCDFTAQDTDEANYMLAVIHFFRAATKMFYGQNQSPKTGTPPPLCYLYGFGQLQFNAHPLVISNFNYNLPTDVDYIRATTSPSSPPGVNRSPSNTRDNSPDISNSRLNSGGQSIAPGGQVPPAQLPQTAAGGTVEPTYVPTKINLQITAYPITTRYDQSRVFNNKQYNNGQLLLGSQRGLGGGFW